MEFEGLKMAVMKVLFNFNLLLKYGYPRNNSIDKIHTLSTAKENRGQKTKGAHNKFRLPNAVPNLILLSTGKYKYN